MKINKQTNFDMTLNLPNETIPLDAKLTKKQGYLLESLQDPKKYKDASNKNKNNSESKIYNISQLPMEINENLSPKDIVNEIYKDVLTRYECMQGNLINHNIGFMYDVTLDDERNVLGEEEYKKRIAFQKKLYETIQEKIHSVRTLGTVIDYSKDNYSTISNDFSNIVIDKFYSLYKNGMIYLEEKPMNYCSSCGKYYDKTQIDYVRKKHVNLYAMYRVKDDNGAISKYNNLRNTYVVATTIYPWTVAVSEKLAIRENTTYSIVEIEQISGTHHYIIEKDKVEKVMQDAFFTKYIIKDEITSEELSKFILISPMDYTKEISMLSISEELVSPDTNNTTGIRIILPEYSYIDFLIYKKLNIEIPSPAIDISSKILKGNVRVVGKRINEVNDFIISYLKKGEFVFLEDYIPVVVPVCRECKKELIYIAKPALYIRSNEEQAIKIKEQAIKMLSLAEFVKEADRKNQFKNKSIENKRNS